MSKTKDDYKKRMKDQTVANYDDGQVVNERNTHPAFEPDINLPAQNR